MSLQTTLAAAAASAARRQFREHLHDCVPCSSRRARNYCHEGGMLRAALQAADNQLAYEQKMDRRPPRGQQALDGLEPPGQLDLFGDVLP